VALVRHQRPDGTAVGDAPGYRRFMPALMPTRNGSAVYFDQRIRADETERFLAAVRESHPELHPTLFHVVLWSLARMFDRHPHLNRFVAGGRLYQRNSITIAFTVKSELTDDGTLLEVKHCFDPAQPFVDLVRDLQAEVASSRHGQQGLADRELELFLRLPPVLRRGVVRVASAANAWSLLPRSFIDGDPFFASAFVTNLGSVGLDAAFHHLYEYGTIPIFGALGKVHETVEVEDGHPVVERTASMKFTFDERIEDGLYAARAIADFRTMVEHPMRDSPS
jgi:hypothetical protein